jgi:hypothetical protein
VKALLTSLLLSGALLGAAAPAAAQSRPLVTEDPETVPAGMILVEAGVDLVRGMIYQASGLTGNLARLGTFGMSLGVSSIAEVQVDGALVQRLQIRSIDPLAPLNSMYTGGATSTSGIDDLWVGAKVRFVSETETRPSVALRFTTRVPLATNESGLGLGTTDFGIALAIAKTVRSVRVATNLGIGFLGDPIRGDEQNRVLTYGVSVARAVFAGAELVAELNGRVDTGQNPPPPGTESRAIAKIGGRYTTGPVRLDAGLLIGITQQDPSWGVSIGATWVFKAFNVK